MTIGERLEEARKRKGISIREAAEATKIRGDYLVNLENSSFDIDLPAIYIRGFLKNYARFLKLDPEKILLDYEAVQTGLGRPAKRENRESLGRLEIPEEEAGSSTGSTSSSHSDPLDRPASLEPDRSTYLKVGITVGSLSLLVLIAILLYNVFAVKPEVTTPPESSQPLPAANFTAGTELTLVALDNVTVIVTQAGDNRKLFSGDLKRGDRKTIQRTGPIIVRYTNGSALEVEQSGKRYKMGSPSVGFNKFP